MLGFILLLVLKVCSSNAVVATVGSNITLECTLSGSFTMWQKRMTGFWSSKLVDSSKYENTSTVFLTIFNIDVNDTGTYRCSAGSQQLQIGLIVTDSGTWTQWTQWTPCSKTCGVGESTRSRSCQGGACSGSGFESMDCATTPCPVNGGWSVWGAWSTCSVTCGSGVLTRYRSCISPPPAHGGYNCQGNNDETTSCPTTPCPVNGNWGAWGGWSTCSTTCGNGILKRYRACNRPSPANGGSYCPGDSYDRTTCFKLTCPVNGNWGMWGAWGTCSRTCGSGTWKRSRSCDNPTPAHGGSDCLGNKYDTTQCFKPTCPVNGNWGVWGARSTCSATCGSGVLTRYKSCNSPAPAHGGSYCQGGNSETIPCLTTPCPVESEEDSSSAAIGIGAGIGSTGVAVGLLIIFIYILQQYRLRNPAEGAIYDTTGETKSSNSELHIYDGLQPKTESPTNRQNDVNYVNMVI